MKNLKQMNMKLNPKIMNNHNDDSLSLINIIFLCKYCLKNIEFIHLYLIKQHSSDSYHKMATTSNIIEQIINDFKTLDLSHHQFIESIVFKDIEYACHKIVYINPADNQIIDSALNYEIELDEGLFCDVYPSLRLLILDNKRFILYCSSEGNNIAEL